MKPSSAFAIDQKLEGAAIRHAKRWPIVLVLCGLLSTLAACRDPITFSSMAATTSNPASGATWHGPYPLDLGDVRDPTLTTFYATASTGPSNPPFYPSTYGYTQSYGSFHLETAPTFGAMAASLFDGTNLRPFGRTYHPFAQGGNGWSSYGSQAGFLDATSSKNAFYIALGLSPSGAGLALFSDGATTTNTADALLQAAGNWSALPSQNGVSAHIGTSLPAGTLPGAGYVPAVNGAPGIPAANGSGQSVAWDAGGHAFYSYIDQSDSQRVSYIDTYTAFSSWSSDPALLYKGLRLGPLSSQTQVLGDGLGVTPLWVGEDMLTSTQIAMGQKHGCAVNGQGTLVCWGNNSEGQTGVAASVGAVVAFPTPISGLNGVVALAGGYEHTCAATQAGNLSCWGSNSSGQIGNGAASSQPVVTPTTVVGVPGKILKVAAGVSHTCALTDAEEAYCWGENAMGQIGNGAALPPPAPTYVLTPFLSFPFATQIASGDNHACALNPNGKVFCWGDNSKGQLGNVPAGPMSSTSVLAGSGYQLVAAGGNHTCTLDSGTGIVSCWGDNASGQIGNATTGGTQTTPTAVAGGLVAKSLALGDQHTCALKKDGSVYCWGDNNFGQIGNGTTSAVPFNVPQLVKIPVGLTVTAIAAGKVSTCALTNLGTVLCWGSNQFAENNGNDYNLHVLFETLPTELAASSNQAVLANWTLAASPAPTTVSSGDVKSMSAATDGNGNVVTVFLQTQPGFVTAPSGSITAPYPVRNNNVRVYAAMRGASGIWTGPTQLDDAAQFVPMTTTVYQEAWGRATGNLNNVTGGIEYFTPAIAYLGSGRFLAAFAMTDVANSTSSIYVRGYTVGQGWDPSTQTYQLDTFSFANAGATEAFRYANELSLVGDGQGDALLTAQVVIPSGLGSDVTQRNYAMKAFVYSDSLGGWRDHGFLIPNSLCMTSLSIPTGPTSSHFCWGLKPQGMIFPGPEAVVVYPAPAGASQTVVPLKATPATSLRLYTTELRQ